MKRKPPGPADNTDAEERPTVSTPKRQKTVRTTSHAKTSSPNVTPSKRTRGGGANPTASSINGLQPSGLRTPQRKEKAASLFTTPAKKKPATGTPSRTKDADRSAKRKSARVLLEQQSDDEAWDGADKLAEEILEEEGDDDAAEDVEEPNDANAVPTIEQDGEQPAPADQPPKKRRAGRPKGAKNKRSPTPEGDIPPHERFFFQNRPGPPQTSNNTLSKVSLLTHEEYFDLLKLYEDPFREEKELLLDIHHRAFPQWRFEFHEGFNICLYGYGSKRRLVQKFADWLHQRSPSQTIVMVNGYTPNISVRSIIATVASAVLGDGEEDAPSKLGAQPGEVLDLLQSTLQSQDPDRQPKITVLINSIDAPPLRRAAVQVYLARLAALPAVNVLATVDTPNFAAMWDVSLRDQFNFVFHDCTTFAGYDGEYDVVDEVHGLLGKKGKRVGGKEGVTFVLKSLPENARNLYRLLLTELLSLESGDGGHISDEEDRGVAETRQHHHEETGIEFRTLYQKASEEFIASSEMMFRTLLKEFHDHQMVTSRIDATGAETLSVPLSREEMEGVLEELVLA
ncbi:hypothetical protein VTN31DRAFT_4764 [Thermomyces dupontii]|uniref:uncharacterized protein n=1 Tax=Talaromyces thermophilus TaxID=28565 RepID=UPI003744169E